MDGLDRLLRALEENGSGGLTLASEDVRLTLQGARERGWPFERAWNFAINRVQPMGGVQLVNEAELRDARRSLEEDRAVFRAAYEGSGLVREERVAAHRAGFDRAGHGPPMRRGGRRRAKLAA